MAKLEAMAVMAPILIKGRKHDVSPYVRGETWLSKEHSRDIGSDTDVTSSRSDTDETTEGDQSKPSGSTIE